MRLNMRLPSASYDPLLVIPGPASKIESHFGGQMWGPEPGNQKLCSRIDLRRGGRVV